MEFVYRFNLKSIFSEEKSLCFLYLKDNLILIMCYFKVVAPTDYWMVECKWQQNTTNPENCRKSSQILSTSGVMSNIYDLAVATQTHFPQVDFQPLVACRQHCFLPIGEGGEGHE